MESKIRRIGTLGENDALRNIGKNIRKYRELHGLTRERLAEIVETDAGYLGQCERGETQLGIAKTVRIIEYFGVSPQEIIALPNKNHKIGNDKYIAEIVELLKGCTDNQLALITKMLVDIIPFIKD